MIDPPWLSYLLAWLTAAFVALFLTPLAIKIAARFGFFDRPGGHKSHAHPTPYLGGLAMVGGFVVAVGGAAILRPPVSGLDQLVAILLLGLALSAVGLVDDLRGLSVRVRILAQLLAAAALWAFDVRVQLVDILWIDAALTVVWVVGIANAMNLLDNMDGLSAGIAMIASMWFGALAAINGQVLVGALAFALAGCALGFLRQNRYPARIYMGDAGSLFLGVVLAAIGIKLQFPELPRASAALIPILVLTVPVLDTSLVVIERLRHGLSPFQGGRDHLSHRLVRIGLPIPVAVTTIGLLGFAHGWMALIVSRVDVATAYIAAGLVVIVDGLLLGLAASVPVYENSRGRDLVVVDRGRLSEEPPR